jgi:hypothetical protein
MARAAPSASFAGVYGGWRNMAFSILIRKNTIDSGGE